MAIISKVYTYYIYNIVKLRGNMAILDNLKMYLYLADPVSITKDDKDAAKKLVQSAASDPIFSSKPTNSGETLPPDGTIPLASTSKNESTGLSVEKTGSTTTPAKTTTAKPGPTFETQTIKWFGDTAKNPELWNTLSDEEKQRRSDIALKGMIDSYNDNQVRLWNDVPETVWNKMTTKQKQAYKELAAKEVDPKTGKQKELKQMTVAEQYDLYVGRCKTKEEVARLTKTVKSMSKEDQLEAFKNSYKYLNPEFRDAAEKILAVDYTQLHEDNVVAAAKETENFSLGNQVLAAQNAAKAIVSKQEELIKTFMEREQETIDTALAQQVGDFGKKSDGTIDTQVQLDCFKEVATTTHQKALKEAASNINELCSENQVPATDIVIDTNNEDAILAAASQAYKCSEENQAAIKLSLLSTKYGEQVQVVFARVEQEQMATQETQEKIDVVEQAVDTKTETLTSREETQAKIDNIEKRISKNQNIKDDVKNLSDSQKIALLKRCQKPEVIRAMIDLGASTEILASINVDTIKGIDYKKMTGTILNFLNDGVQTYIVQKCKDDGSLNDINPCYLKAGAKKVYNEAIENKQSKESQEKGRYVGVIGR